MENHQIEFVRLRFEEISLMNDEVFPLAEAALLIAIEAGENLDIQRYLDNLSELAKEFTNFRKSRPKATIAKSMISFIYEESGFSGNRNNYYDPANSYLNKVIDNKVGIPVSLALLHLSIGNQLDIPVEGIAFPGHFLVRYVGDGGSLIDPFFGRELSTYDCKTLLKQISGGSVELDHSHFQVATKKEILIRMIDNLKQIFWKEKKWERCQMCIEKQIFLSSHEGQFELQLGAMYEIRGNLDLAQDKYESIITNEASDENVRSIASKRLLSLSPKPRIIH